MSTISDMSRSLVVGGSVVLLLCMLLWLALLLMLWELNSSDTAGNGLTRDFASLAVIALWSLLSVLVALASVAGKTSLSSRLGAVVLLPASGVAAFFIIAAAARPAGGGRSWLILLPAMAPVAIVAYCLWAVPSMRRGS